MNETKAVLLQLPPHLATKVEGMLKIQEKILRKAAKDKKKLANKEIEKQVWGKKLFRLKKKKILLLINIY